MENNIVDPIELERIEKIKKRESNVKAIERERLIKSAMLGASSGILGAFIVPASIKELSFSDGHKGGSLNDAILFGAFGAFAMNACRKLYDKHSFVDRKNKIGSNIHAAMVETQQDIEALSKSYESIFTSFVDGYVSEGQIYEASYDLLRNKLELEPVEDNIEKVLKPLVNSTGIKIKDIEDSLLSLANKDKDKDKPKEETVSNVTLSPFQPIQQVNNTKGKTEKEKLADALSQLRQELAIAEDELKEESNKRILIQNEITKLEKDVDIKVGSYSDCLANRIARDRFEDYFIKGMMKIYKNLTDLAFMPVTQTSEIVYLERELFSLLCDKRSLEVNYKEFTDDIDWHLNKNTSVSRNLKRSGSIDMTYSSAPFWKIFQTFVPLSSVEESTDYKDSLSEILEGARIDAEEGNEKGTWLAVRNYADTWLFSIGEFSDDQASRLSEYLSTELEGEFITASSDLSKVNKAYKLFVRKTHSDESNGDSQEADLLVAEVSTLMKAFRKYHENYNEIFGGEQDGTTGQTKI